MNCKKYEGQFTKIVIQKTEAHYGKVLDVKDNLVVFQCTDKQILTLNPDNISSIVPNGKEVEDGRL